MKLSCVFFFLTCTVLRPTCGKISDEDEATLLQKTQKDEGSLKQDARRNEKEKKFEGELAEVVEVVFPALSVDTASLLQSNNPVTLLEAKASHAFTVILGKEVQFMHEKIEEGEYLERSIPAQIGNRSGFLIPWDVEILKQKCPSRVLVCSGKIPESLPQGYFIKTGCSCNQGALLEVPKKVVKVVMRPGLTGEELDAAAQQITHVKKQAVEGTLLMLNKQDTEILRDKVHEDFIVLICAVGLAFGLR